MVTRGLGDDYPVSANWEKFTILHTGALLVARDLNWLKDPKRFLGGGAHKHEKATEYLDEILHKNTPPRFQLGLYQW